MKKLALLMILVLVVSLSCVFATDNVNSLLMAPANSGEISGEVISGENLDVVVSGEEDTDEPAENVSGEVLSGEEIADTEDTTTPDIDEESNHDHEEETIPSSNNSAIIGAIIAIVIVVAVVAIAAILRKD